MIKSNSEQVKRVEYTCSVMDSSNDKQYYRTSTWVACIQVRGHTVLNWTECSYMSDIDLLSKMYVNIFFSYYLNEMDVN